MSPGLRELKKQRTRAAIQQAALSLIDRMRDKVVAGEFEDHSCH